RGFEPFQLIPAHYTHGTRDRCRPSSQAPGNGGEQVLRPPREAACHLSIAGIAGGRDVEEAASRLDVTDGPPGLPSPGDGGMDATTRGAASDPNADSPARCRRSWSGNASTR